jgi:hypothetical protein
MCEPKLAEHLLYLLANDQSRLFSWHAFAFAELLVDIREAYAGRIVFDQAKVRAKDCRRHVKQQVPLACFLPPGECTGKRMFNHWNTKLAVSTTYTLNIRKTCMTRSSRRTRGPERVGSTANDVLELSLPISVRRRKLTPCMRQFSNFESNF